VKSGKWALKEEESLMMREEEWMVAEEEEGEAGVEVEEIAIMIKEWMMEGVMAITVMVIKEDG
jgi:hypothetical protein